MNSALQTKRSSGLVYDWPRAQLGSALLFFFVIQSIGLLMRWQFVKPTPGLNYTFFLHAHSHVALLGWVHAVLAIALPRAFLAPEISRRPYQVIFWLSQICVLGMLLSFPIQGYALISITFSTLFLFCSYALAYYLRRDTRGDLSLSRRLLEAGLFFMVISSLGPWSLGPIMALKLAKSAPYYLSIYFYLHFQYNGWFMLGGSALGLRYLEPQKGFQQSQWHAPVRYFIWSVWPALALSTLFLEPPFWVYLIGAVGAGLQVVSLIGLLRSAVFKSWLQGLFKQPGLQNWPGYLLLLSSLCFVGKVALQALTAFPYFAQMAAQQRALVIFYLHLVLLGCVSVFLLAYLIRTEVFRIGFTLKMGLLLFVGGFLGSESLLFYQGFSGWLGRTLAGSFYIALASVSLGLPLGFLLIALSIQRQPPSAQEAI